MKKLFLLMIVAAFAVSCEGPMGPVGPAGKVNKVWNSDLKVLKNQWQTGDDIIGPFYFFDLQIPQLDREMINGDGLYQLMLRYKDDGYEIRQTLETTIYHTEDDGYLWSENISAQFQEGWARVLIRYSDFDMNRTPPDIMEFIFAGMY